MRAEARIRAVGAPADARWFRAPGRVNLMGDHTDYNDGLALPVAIDRDCVVAARSRDDGVVRVRSTDLAASCEVAADGTGEPASVEPAFGRYVAGVVRELARRGRAPTGLEAVLASDVPAGGGLSSSAALEVACALALCDAAGFHLERTELALACQAAEHAATGVRSGAMDQLTSARAVAGAALLLDCRSLETEPVPLPPGLAVLVVHSGVSRELADTAYAERRRECEEAAARLGLPALRDARPEQVQDDPRARHVVSEIARARDTAAALRKGDEGELGRLMLESHASLRDDFEVSTRELDLLVEELVAAGAAGARMTGAGFGGCVVALVEDGRATSVGERAGDRYGARTGREPLVFVCHAGSAAGPV